MLRVKVTDYRTSDWLVAMRMYQLLTSIQTRLVGRNTGCTS